MKDLTIQQELKNMGYEFILDDIEINHPNNNKTFEDTYNVYFKEIDDIGYFISYQQKEDNTFHFIYHKMNTSITFVANDREALNRIVSYCDVTKEAGMVVNSMFRDRKILLAYIDYLFLQSEFIDVKHSFTLK